MLQQAKLQIPHFQKSQDAVCSDLMPVTCLKNVGTAMFTTSLASPFLLATVANVLTFSSMCCCH